MHAVAERKKEAEPINKKNAKIVEYRAMPIILILNVATSSWYRVGLARTNATRPGFSPPRNKK
jgi:hypothetical protein